MGSLGNSMLGRMENQDPESIAFFQVFMRAELAKLGQGTMFHRESVHQPPLSHHHSDKGWLSEHPKRPPTERRRRFFFFIAGTGERN